MKVPSFLLELDKEKQEELLKWLREGTQGKSLDYALTDAIWRYDDPEYDRTTPLFDRQCDKCRFLGNYMGASLYFCTDKKYRGVYAQVKNERELDGVITDISEPNNPLIIEAFRLARKRGFKNA